MSVLAVILKGGLLIYMLAGKAADALAARRFRRGLERRRAPSPLPVARLLR